MPAVKPDIKLILKLLIGAYHDRLPVKRLAPVAELILTILSQNTSDTNSRRAFTSLTTTFSGWNEIAAADTQTIAAAIKSGGLAEVKARYISQALAVLQKNTHDFDLNFLNNMTVPEARAWLMQLPGVGMKTASCVLLFSLSMPAFPVDTHVFRVAGRLGLVDIRAGANAAHITLESIVKPDDTYRCHVLLIEHGRKTCKSQRPLCNNCALFDICPQGRILKVEGKALRA